MTRPNCLNINACAAKTPGKHCSRCSMTAWRQDPAVEAKRVAAWQRKLDDPEFRAVHSARSQHNLARWRQRPEVIAAMRERGLVNLAKANTPEATAARVALVQEQRLGWCPKERRDEYRALARTMPAAEARRIIEAEIPGTVEHAKRQIDNIRLAQRLRAEREQSQAY